MPSNWKPTGGSNIPGLGTESKSRIKGASFYEVGVAAPGSRKGGKAPGVSLSRSGAGRMVQNKKASK